MITAISFSFMILAVSDVTVSVTLFSDNTSFALSQLRLDSVSDLLVPIQNQNKSFYINEMHIRFHSIQMEITTSQFRTNCVQKWLVCASARHVFHVFASLPYNAPVRV